MNHPTSESSMSPDDLTGQSLGDYQLLRRLGRGGMAVVYLAKQGSLNRNIALKILNPELAKDSSYVKRFQQEAQAAAALVQANIVQIYEVGECNGFHFIAQEYVQGRNLKQYLHRHGAVEPVMAINVLRQCSMALQKATEHHVIHRDIKPENIMLSTKGEVKITDFGLARINNNSAQQDLTQVGITMGTPLYMSPEQVEGGPLDHRSDIYSLGVTAYHMLAGSPPFEGDNALAIAVKHLNHDAIRLSMLRPDIPVELCQIIQQMMSKDRSDRPTDAKQLLKDLRKIKIDTDDDWEIIVEKLAVSDTGTLTDTSSWSQSRLAATRQLQSVMKGNTVSFWKAPGMLITLIIFSLVAVLGGVMFARQTPPDTLLNLQNFDSSEIPKKDTAMEQYRAAYWASLRFDDNVKKEMYWKAVMDYFPPQTAPDEKKDNTVVLYNRLAKQRLGELYLTSGRLDDALAIYEEFVGYESLATRFQTIGYAGKAVVFDGMPDSDFEDGVTGKTLKIREAMGKALPNEELLDDYPFMKTRFDRLKSELQQNDEPAPTGILDSRDDSNRFLKRFNLFIPVA